jgi:hypothetical protein
MNRAIVATLLSTTLLCLLLPNASISTTLINGGVQNSGIIGPEAIILNIASVALKATLNKANNYYLQKGTLAPANRFRQKFKAPSPFKLITNNAKGDIILVFSQMNPGSLKGKKIRCAIPSPPNYIKAICITNIDQGNSGQPFFINPTKSFTPSITIQASDMGSVYTAPTNAVNSMSYKTIETRVQQSSSSSNQAATGTSSSSSIG